ncbi:MAG: DEAD/DEAH box helicase [Deltaproteobacteria bacterium]|nr:DEAD/DEAH box helicase [Deltaproteobacteria bacterium]
MTKKSTANLFLVPNKKNSKSYAQLLKSYTELSLTHQTIVNVLSVIFTETSRITLIECLSILGARGPDNKFLTIKTLPRFIKQMILDGIIEGNSSVRCAITLREPICRMLLENRLFDIIARVVEEVIPQKKDWAGDSYPDNYDQFVRNIRIGLYRKDTAYVKNLLLNNLDRYKDLYSYQHPYVNIFKYSFDADWMAKNLSDELLVDVLKVLLENAENKLLPINKDVFPLLQSSFKIIKAELKYPIAILIAEQLILQGKIADAEQVLVNFEGLEALSCKGLAAFLAGRNEESISHYNAAFKLLKKTTKKRKIYFNTIPGIFFIFALIKSGTNTNFQAAKNYTNTAYNDIFNPFQEAYRFLFAMLQAREGDSDFAETLLSWPLPPSIINPFNNFTIALSIYWINKKKIDKTEKFLKELHKKSERNGYEWLAAESAELLSRLLSGDTFYKAKATLFRKKTKIETIVDLVKPEAKWEQVLRALTNIQQLPSKNNKKISRMVWLFDFFEKYHKWDISPREQTRNAKGVWSKGKPIALKRLYNQIETFNFLTPQDIKICSCIKEEYESNWRGHSKTSYYFSSRVLTLLVGHPLLFWETSPTVQLEIVKGEPELIVSKSSKGKFELSFYGSLDTYNKIHLIKESPTRIKVIELNEEVKQIAKILNKGIQIPAIAKKQVFDAVKNVSSLITVHSEIDGIISDAKKMSADPKPHFHLLPFGHGLKLNLLTRPFSTDGPYFRPGEGGETVISKIGNQQFQAKRNLKKEKKLADQAVSGCPRLFAIEESEAGDAEWHIEEPEDCLETLLELQALGKSAIVEWPEGQSYKIRQQADINKFHLRIKKQQEWFSVSGELKLDNDLVVSIQELFKLLNNSTGRFIQLKDGQFLALTKTFRKRLEEMKAYSNKSGKDLRFHPLAALSLDDLTEDIGSIRGDKEWKAHLKRMTAASVLEPKLPSTFKAELRDYQTEGFKWLARLSHWGVGACLADDMGLGKTIEALSIILEKAAKGPTLIVAPVSVCMNWETEAERFAPTLNFISLLTGNRKKTLESLKAFDLLVISYGLLQQTNVAEMISEINFQTIVLDEAQAIKNFTTKRSQAAMKLKGEFKLITTGTPIENHLGELWNLFRFINPGFLGSLSHFNKNFVVPIEKYQDRKARRQLKKLIQPFMLRRTKNQVLEELPPRTDILLNVELSTEEMAVYEALRRQAIEKLENKDMPPGQKHLQIFAEIMKLRRACCNTSLVLPDTPLPSSKLTVFGNLLDELILNKHKALVFSQFIDHLKIIREHVEGKGISYQYFDGSTTQKERKKRVDAFQAGESDIFLISLKAGGLGINLTAADYVIHMDPWWNPAVEDQASDRAHRIGQKRPVTVYRLVVKDTIEEKIVALHQKKRDLADSLLGGADMSGKMSANELLRLIKEN